MQQLHLTKPNSSDEIEGDPKQLQSLKTELEKLRSGRMRWDDFLEKRDLSDPFLRAAQTREGDTLLHLAVMACRKDVLNILGKDPVFIAKRNKYGFTAFEVGRFLEDPTLGLSKETPFCSYPCLDVADFEKHDFFKKICFLRHPIFENHRGLYDVLSRAQKAKLEDQIPAEKIWMGIYFDKEICKGIHPSVSIQFIDTKIGFGVFAKTRIPSCSFVGEYTGIVCERKRKHLKHKHYCVRYPTWEMDRKNFVIDAEEKGNFTRFINHSDDPNLSLQSAYWRGMPRMIFIALKEISEGSQLTFDYGSFFWKECQQIPKLL